MTDIQTKPVSRRTAVLLGLGLAVGVFLADVLTLTAPGISVDEAIYTWQAQEYGRKLQSGGLASLVNEQSPDYLFTHRIDHPPLGRLWLALVHGLVTPGGLSLVGMRLAVALAFGGLAGIVYAMAWRWVGLTGAITATASLVLLPRLFGHAHFATMEPILCLTFTAAIATAGWALAKPSYGRGALAGLVFGLALLTKMQAVLIPVVVLPWALWQGRLKAVGPLLVWGVTALAVFFLGWPWLWHDPVGRLQQYLSTGTQRDVIWLYYFGTKYQDAAVPWHYPLVMLALTVPVGLLGLSLVGAGDAIRRRRDGAVPLLWLGVVLLFVVFFAIPGIPIYDGVRHLLPAVVFVALLAGLGAQRLVQWAGRRLPSVAACSLLGIFLLSQAWGTVRSYPFHLSYYNLLCGGLAGAERAGMTVTYWGEAVDEAVLSRVGAAANPGDVVGFAPVLMPGVLQHYAAHPAFAAKGLQAVPFQPGRCDWLVVFHRRAYIDDPTHHADLIAATQTGHLQFRYPADGVWLVKVYRL